MYDIKTKKRMLVVIPYLMLEKNVENISVWYI
jgi:hypothetical protein